MFPPYSQQPDHPGKEPDLLRREMLDRVVVKFPDRHKKHFAVVFRAVVPLVVLLAAARPALRRGLVFLFALRMFVAWRFCLLDRKAVGLMVEPKLEPI